MIPEHFIQDLLDRSDIVTVIDSYVSLKKAGKDWVACCPFHQEKSPSFTVSPSKQFYHCFGCGAHGSAIGFLMEHQGMGFVDAVHALAQRAGMTVPAPEKSKREAAQKPEDDKLIALLERAQKHFLHSLREHPVAIAYAKQRGLTGVTARDFGIGFAAGDILTAFSGVPAKDMVEAGLLTVKEETGEVFDKFRQRLMFPILSERGRVIGFGGRIIGEGKPKYLNSPESRVFVKGKELYGLYQAKQAIRQSRVAIVLEGYMDVAMLHQHGERRAVAALGTSLTEDQVDRLYRMADEIVLCFDGDAAGQKAANRSLLLILAALRDGKSARFVVLPDGHDPDTFVSQFGLDAWNKALKDGLPLSAVVVKHLSQDKNLELPEDRAKFASEAAELIDMISGAPVFQEALAQHLEKMAGLPVRRSAARAPGKPVAASGPSKSDAGEVSAPERGRSAAPKPLPSRAPVYTNLAIICALDLESVQYVPVEMMDETAAWIVSWFSELEAKGEEDRVGALAAMDSVSLRPFLHLGVQRAEEKKRNGDNQSVRAEIQALVDAIVRVADREKKRGDFNQIFDSTE